MKTDVPQTHEPKSLKNIDNIRKNVKNARSYK